jgi:hypothetical protein
MFELQYLKTLLDSVHPSLFLLTIAFALWGAQWAVRRWLPSVWEFAANLPWIDKLSLGEQLTRFDLAMRKAWQAVPSAVLGAVLMALATRGDLVDAGIGAAFGLLAPALHELLKALPGPYGTKRE